MDDPGKTSTDPNEQTDWAVNLLHKTFQQLESEYSNYNNLEDTLKFARFIVKQFPEIAVSKAIKLLQEAPRDATGYNTMCLIQGMEKVNTPEWVEYLHEASTDMRDAVSSTAKEALAMIGENTSFPVSRSGPLAEAGAEKEPE